jgi:hypothetical protein
MISVDGKKKELVGNVSNGGLSQQRPADVPAFPPCGSPRRCGPVGLTGDAAFLTGCGR